MHQEGSDVSRAFFPVAAGLLCSVVLSSVTATAAPAPRPSWDQPVEFREPLSLLDTLTFGQPLSVQPISGDTVYTVCLERVFSYPAGYAGSDCWGYIDEFGNEYAFFGNQTTLGVIDVTNMVKLPDIVWNFDCGWRDMMTYGDYLYMVEECGAGILVIDLSPLPFGSPFVVTAKPTDGGGYGWSHNLCVDSVAGYLYVEGWGASGWTNTNIFIHDLSNPANPTFVTGFSSQTVDIHDMYAYNDTVYVANGSSQSYSIWDLSDKFNAQLLTTWVTPSGGYAHNIWPTPDHQHVVTTEETPGRTVKVWDISDFENIQLVGEYLGPSGLAHNAQVQGDKVYISHYESGLSIVDISDPTNPTELAIYDTDPDNDPVFDGAWGVYPHSPTGNIFVSNMNEKLFVLSEKLAVINDTMFIDTAGVEAGNDVRVEFSVTNSQDTRQILLPFSWAGPAGLTYDSFSVAGMRTDYFEEANLVSYNPFGKEASISLVSSYAGTQPDLPPGSGPVLSVWFSVPGGASCGVSPVVFKPISGSNPTISDACGIAISPEIHDGAVDVCSTVSSCCVVPGDADHGGSVNIADVTYEIGFIFSGGPAPPCEQEGDADASGAVNIADATYLIAVIFSGGPAPICGP